MERTDLTGYSVSGAELILNPFECIALKCLNVRLKQLRKTLAGIAEEQIKLGFKSIEVETIDDTMNFIEKLLPDEVISLEEANKALFGNYEFFK